MVERQLFEQNTEMLEIIIQDKTTGKIMMKESIGQKHFSTGSVGYYVSGKMTNEESGERYQMTCNIILIGSKPEK